MKENLILVCAVAVSVFFIGLPFVCQALRCRRNIRNSEPAENEPTAEELTSQTPEDKHFVARFTGLQQPPFTAGKTVRIRPQYYQRIKEVISRIGHDEISIISYVDNVLKAHFDDHNETINSLCDGRSATQQDGKME